MPTSLNFERNAQCIYMYETNSVTFSQARHSARAVLLNLVGCRVKERGGEECRGVLELTKTIKKQLTIDITAPSSVAIGWQSHRFVRNPDYVRF